MSEAKFTKGEWVAFYPHELLNSGHASVESESGRQICMTEAYKSNLEEVTANMNLIAAAPEMYDEIERDIEWLESILAEFAIGSPMHGSILSRIQEKQSILAKARGESCK